MNDDCAMPSSGASTERWLRLEALKPQVRAQVRRLGLSRSEAEDIAAEAVLRAAVKTDLDLDRAHSWLYVVARNLAVDAYRARPNQAVLARLHAQSLTEPDVFERVADADEARVAASFIEALPPRQRRAVQLRANGMSLKEIANVMGVQYGAVESLFSRAKETIVATLAAFVGLMVSLVHGRRSRQVVVAVPALALATWLGGFTLVPHVMEEADRSAPRPLQ